MVHGIVLERCNRVKDATAVGVSVSSRRSRTNDVKSIGGLEKEECRSKYRSLIHAKSSRS